jgi:hypothetical protein
MVPILDESNTHLFTPYLEEMRMKLNESGPSADDGLYSGFRAESSLSEVAVHGGDAAVAGVQMG